MNEPTPFIDYLNACDKLLEDQYGITFEDHDLKTIAQFQDDGETPQQVVDYYSLKWDLQPLDN